ncbi:ras-related protein Rab-26-like [Tiliqua scincoides]|uniref:ras-related protein Rab-26-like n=1 Tax=Tiliqua scincoides TaxID=71010 RepID=UPI00346329B3
MAASSPPTFKLILLGDFGVGKTTLFHRVRTGHFLQGAHTIDQHMGVCEKALPLKHSRSGLQVQISLWDTAGEERFLSLNNCYFRDADAVLLMYSVSGPVSFDSLSHWLYVARQYCADADVFLLGNKSDLENCVPEEKAERFAEEHSASGRYKVSAKTGENVNWCLQEVADKLFLKKEYQRSGIHALQEAGYLSHCSC